jgi:hypothetical protein
VRLGLVGPVLQHGAALRHRVRAEDHCGHSRRA